LSLRIDLHVLLLHGHAAHHHLHWHLASIHDAHALLIHHLLHVLLLHGLSAHHHLHLDGAVGALHRLDDRSPPSLHQARLQLLLREIYAEGSSRVSHEHCSVGLYEHLLRLKALLLTLMLLALLLLLTLLLLTLLLTLLLQLLLLDHKLLMLELQLLLLRKLLLLHGGAATWVCDDIRALNLLLWR